MSKETAFDEAVEIYVRWLQESSSSAASLAA